MAIVLAAGIFSYVSATATRGGGGGNASAGADGQSGVDILLGLANGAIEQQHLVAPQGSNAYEFYLSVLQLDPNNAVAQKKLKQLFPAATADVEGSINQDDLDEAQRELNLLREYDSTNYTLSLLGGKLDAHRQLQVSKHEAQAALIQAEHQGKL